MEAAYAVLHHGKRLVGNFLHGADPPAVNQCASPPPVRLPTYSSLWEILAARAGKEGAMGGMGGRKIPRDGWHGGRGAVVRTREGGGAKLSKERAARRRQKRNRKWR